MEHETGAWTLRDDRMTVLVFFSVYRFGFRGLIGANRMNERRCQRGCDGRACGTRKRSAPFRRRTFQRERPPTHTIMAVVVVSVKKNNNIKQDKKRPVAGHLLSHTHKDDAATASTHARVLLSPRGDI